ncbi:MAG TPA: cupin domain-containing protein [Acidimicrobiia bacterium]
MLSTGTILDIGDHTVEVLETPETTRDRYRIRIVAEPGGPGVDNDFPHLHPTLVETFQCVSGEMTALAGKELVVLPPGEKIEVAPGLLHGFVNTGQDMLTVDSEVIFPNGYRPEDDLMRFAAIYDWLRRQGPVNARTGEPPLLQIAVLTHAYRKVITPPGIAGALIPLLSALGHLRGYRSEFPEPNS